MRSEFALQDQIFNARLGGQAMRLTDAKLRALIPTGKIQRIHDEKGLYLELTKAKSMRWYWKYTYNGKETRMSLGRYPDLSLKEVRNKRDDFRRILDKGENPSGVLGKKNSGITFQELADEWLTKKTVVWAPSTYKRFNLIMTKRVFPFLGNSIVTEINPTSILSIVRKAEQERFYETASRILIWCSLIFRYGVAIGIIQSDPCRDLKGALTQHQNVHYAALTKPREVGTLLVAIDEYAGTPQVRYALKLAALTFCRPGEVRRAEWTEVDFELKEWIIPKGKMKNRKEQHRVPLSRQALEVLQSIRAFTGGEKYIFTGRNGRPLSDNGMNTALRTMGYKHDQMTPHGFRSIASTLLNELGFRYDVIEIQLAHKGSDKIRAIYNRAEYMEERRRLMQAWADYLDALKEYAMNPGAPLPTVDVATAGR